MSKIISFKNMMLYMLVNNYQSLSVEFIPLFMLIIYGRKSSNKSDFQFAFALSVIWVIHLP